MKPHTTNYQNTFIEIADDSPIQHGEVPPVKGDKKSVANIQFDLVNKNPYKYDSDDVVFESFAVKNDLTESERPAAREQFFSKGQPCLRASPLTKRYGWGVHSDDKGKVAIYGAGTEEYRKFATDSKITLTKAMRSKRG